MNAHRGTMSRLVWGAAEGVSNGLRRALFYLMTRKRTREGAREVCGVGWEWVGQEKWRDARLSGEAAILCDPTWREGYLLAGYSELRAGHPVEGRTIYERGLAIDPDDAREYRSCVRHRRSIGRASPRAGGRSAALAIANHQDEKGASIGPGAPRWWGI
jgi:hypothetical protein